MSKELTPLEALEECINKFVEILLEVKCEQPTAVNITRLNQTIRVAFHNNLDIIEKALKEYEKLKDKYDELETEYCDQQRSMLKYDEVKQKQLKALKIIKEKRVDCWLLNSVFLNGDKVEIYNELLKLNHNNLTQEEYDLLKEVLL